MSAANYADRKKHTRHKKGLKTTKLNSLVKHTQRLSFLQTHREDAVCLKTLTNTSFLCVIITYISSETKFNSCVQNVRALNYFSSMLFINTNNLTTQNTFTG